MLMLVLLVEGQTALTLECNRGRLTPPLQTGLVLPVGQGQNSANRAVDRRCNWPCLSKRGHALRNELGGFVG